RQTGLDRSQAERDMGLVRRGHYDQVDSAGSGEDSVYFTVDLRSGKSLRAWEARRGSEVTIAATSSPGVASTRGAWNTRPASPYPMTPTLRD
ncbi:MAG TPA: hypothetical protein VFC03_18480, partial [Acidimicrobiales bacterium]|nr:hypothetical protein [Acidimicrobiales bacterium]